MNDRRELNVVSDQIGSPTYAADLALTIIKIIESIELGNAHYGIFHYSNSGVISWFDFATAIAKEGGKNCMVHPIPSSAYPTPAKRPAYSVMECSKLVKDYGIELKPWEEGLKKCFSILMSN
jgi:dTDP-4-dehydrorhamnose reductase